MKKFILVISALMLIATLAEAAVTLRYENKDSKEHKMDVKMSGSSKTVEFGSSRTASVTIQGSSTECVIKTSCGEVKVKDGDKIVIKDGCIKVE